MVLTSVCRFMCTMLKRLKGSESLSVAEIIPFRPRHVPGVNGEPSGAGAHLVKDWPIFFNRSIFLTPEGDRTDKKGFSAFNTWKDIIIPGFVDTRVFSSNMPVALLALSKRQYVANYLGRAQGKNGRLQLIQLAKQFPNELEAPELAFQSLAKLERIDYYKHL